MPRPVDQQTSHIGNTIRDDLDRIELGSLACIDLGLENTGPLTNRAYVVAARVVEAWALAQHQADLAAREVA
jgi:hypothetical protein